MALIFPALLSSLVLAAHFLRWGNPPGVLAVLVLTVLALAARRKWSLKLLQGMLFASPFLWAFLAYRTAADRMLEGRPYARACLIFAVVALFSVWSAFLLDKPKARERFGR
ncbi:MAG: hypothetical protein AAB262_02230 [Elusimicrobiota bacterium]